MSKNFYSVRETMALLGMTRVTVHNWILSGKLEGTFKLAGEWVIPLTAIENMSKNNTEKSFTKESK